jgi:hypothetical protein
VGSPRPRLAHPWLRLLIVLVVIVIYSQNLGVTLAVGMNSALELHLKWHWAWFFASDSEISHSAINKNGVFARVEGISWAVQAFRLIFRDL